MVNQSPAAVRIGPTVQITSVPFKIGRGASEANDLSLDEDTSVSRSHAVITFQNGHFFLVDQGSSNGTQVDGTRLAPQAPFQLYDGARIALGKGTELTFKLPGGGAPASGRGPGGEDPDKTDYVKIDDLKQ
jgi:pSer/pThr/pTyr-binding forkhead associated (FHA) protein